MQFNFELCVFLVQADGSIKCSPFHVKLTKKKNDPKIARLKVNGKNTGLIMKIGAAGEAFFVEHSQRHEYIVKRYRSSPPTVAGANKEPHASIAALSETAEAVSHIALPVSQSRIGPVAISGEERNVGSIAAATTQSATTVSDCIINSAAAEPPISENTSIGSDGTGKSLQIAIPATIAPLSSDVAGARGLPLPSAQWVWTWGDLPMKSKHSSKSDLTDLSPVGGELTPLAPGDMMVADSKAAKTVSIGLSQEYRPEESVTASCDSPLERVDGKQNYVGQDSSAEYREAFMGSGKQRLYPPTPRSVHATRMLSLCGHLLSDLLTTNSEIIATPTEVQAILRTHAVQRHDFYANPSEYLNNSNLVVLINDTLFPWSIARVMFETAASAHEEAQYQGNTDVADDEILKIVSLLREQGAGTDQYVAELSDSAVSSAAGDISVSLPSWTGRTVSHWPQFKHVNSAPCAEDSGENGFPGEVVVLAAVPLSSRASSRKSLRGSEADALGRTEAAGADRGESPSERPSGSTVVDVGHGVDIDSPGDSFSMEHHQALQRRTAAVNALKLWGITPDSYDLISARTPSSTSLCQFLQESGIQDATADLLGSFYHNSLHSSEPALWGVDNSFSHGLWTWGDDGEEQQQSTTTDSIAPAAPNVGGPMDNLKAPVEADNRASGKVEKGDSSLPSSDRSSRKTVRDIVVISTDLAASASVSHEVSASIAVTNEVNGKKIDDYFSGNLDLTQLQLLDISLEDICPGPARGDIYDGDSDTDSYYSLSLDEGESSRSMSFDDSRADSSAGLPPPALEGAFAATGSPSGRRIARKYLYRKSLLPTQQQLKDMNLVDGENEIVFEVEVFE